MFELVIHGLGCPKTGGARVFEEILSRFAGRCRVLALAPSGLRERLAASRNVIFIPDRILNSVLRVPLEFLISCAAGSVVKGPILNLSNYGFAVGGDVALMVHSPEILLEAFRFETAANRVKDLLLSWSLATSDVVILQSRHMAATLDRYAKARGVRKPPIILYVTWHERPAGATSLPDAGRFTLFYPASLFPHKRLDLCEALAEDNRLLGVRVQLTNSTLQRGCVDGIGSVSHQRVMTEFSRCHALLFTSERETLGLPLLESLAFGLPAVLPRLPYAEEIYGDAAVYFDDFSAPAIADAILALRADYSNKCHLARQRASLVRLGASASVAAVDSFIDSKNGVIL